MNLKQPRLMAIAHSLDYKKWKFIYITENGYLEFISRCTNQNSKKGLHKYNTIPRSEHTHPNTIESQTNNSSQINTNNPKEKPTKSN